jgi:hypothetical protein
MTRHLPGKLDSYLEACPQRKILMYVNLIAAIGPTDEP